MGADLTSPAEKSARYARLHEGSAGAGAATLMSDTDLAIGQRTSPTSRGEDLVTVGVAAWLMLGLFLDGYAHANILTGTESFLTPWHGVFYSGFIASAAWIIYLIVRRTDLGQPARRAIPIGYGWATIGIVVFASGGIGDGIWHTLLGIEISLDALFSPTHLLLFVGLFLIITAPLRAAWARSDEGPSAFAGLFPAWLSTTLATALVAFFLSYLWSPRLPWLPRQTFDPQSGDGEIMVMLGMATMLITTLLLVAPTLLMLNRWRLPFGSFTVMWAVVGSMIAAAFEPEELAVCFMTGLAGGLAVDATARALRHLRVDHVARIVSGVGPLVMWAVYFAILSTGEPIRWPVEVWAGSIGIAALAGLGLSLLVFPQPMPSVTSQAGE